SAATWAGWGPPATPTAWGCTPSAANCGWRGTTLPPRSPERVTPFSLRGALADGLIVSGGGSTAVATTELFEQAATLRHVVDEIDECIARLATLDRGITPTQLRSWGEPH